MDLIDARQALKERRTIYTFTAFGIVYLGFITYLVLSTFGWALLYIPFTIFLLEFVVPTFKGFLLVLVDFFGVAFFCIFAFSITVFLQKLSEWRRTSTLE